MWIVAVLGILFVAGVESQSCDYGFESFSGSCYFFSHGKLDWIESVIQCRELGAHLVEVDSAAESNYIASRSVANQTYFWIGLTDRLVEGEYVWEHSGNLLNGPGYWGPGEPDASYDKNCVYYYYEDGGSWSDTHCSYTRAYVCEKNPDETVPVG